MYLYLYLHHQHFRKTKHPLWNSTNIIMSKLCRNIPRQNWVRKSHHWMPIFIHAKNVSTVNIYMYAKLLDHHGASHDFPCAQCKGCYITNISMDKRINDTHSEAQAQPNQFACILCKYPIQQWDSLKITWKWNMCCERCNNWFNNKYQIRVHFEE